MPLTQETLPLRIDKNFEMPSIPLMLMKIIQVLDDDKTTARELEDVILHDPSLSVRILKLANSAFYSFRSEVKTISHAVSLLGISLVKSLAIGVNVFEYFTRGLKVEGARINQLWMHSFGVGFISQQIWVPRTSRKEGEFAFLCGLLHDLGSVVYFKKDPIHYGPLFGSVKPKDTQDLSALEMEYYGIDHATVGSMLAKHWGLPLELANVIGKHHDPLSVADPLVAAVALADTLAKQANIGSDGDNKINGELEKLQARLRMDPEEYGRLTTVAAAKRKEVEAFFQLS